MPVILQCPMCSKRFRVEWTPGKSVACLCGQRMGMRGAWDALPTLEPMVRHLPRIRPGEPRDSLPAPTDPILAALAGSRFDPLPLFCLRLQAEYLALDPGFDELLAPSLVRNVEPHEYQVRTVRHILRNLQGRAVFADEVGLGKTIEAGLAIKELILRGLARRVLILTPASLATQWLEEMETKFGLGFGLVDSPEDWQDQPLAIASLDTAKSPKNFERLQAIPQDVVVVDEAHSLKNARTLNWRLVNGIRKKYLFLLSATPIQNDLLELYNLVTLLRPGQLYMRDLLKAVMVRNRRGEVDVKFTNREVVTLQVELSPAERRLYETATAFVRSPEFRALYGDPSRLVALGLLKQLGSSPASFLDTALGRTSAQAGGGGAEKPGVSPSPALQQWFADLETAGQGIAGFSKTERLLAHLLADPDREKMLVFTQYRRTQDSLAGAFRSAGIPVVAFHGGMSREEKDASVEQFRGPARVLVATESGGQGRNLQFCRCLVNYDLPWNPMRIEQRIGRVHRMGQKRDVRVINLIAKDTIEAKIYALLDRKIDLFRLIVGELDMILGRVKFEDEVLDRFLASKDAAEFGGKMEALGTEMQALKQDYHQAQAYDEQVFKEFTHASQAEPPAAPRTVPKRALKGF
ncbi:MAG: DEAD/DEAH box helicase [Planctomycetes bacterium]|nr:DEAD/DEAH box helicase [Planctomycetota bacterium]